MPLTIGTQLGPHKILGPLGAGGMGEVYRALDTQLDRAVAVKVLPYSMASDPERLARFDREAKILAALNHPNIAVIYGMEKFEGGRALIMELVPGDTLGARIKKGGLPQEEALQIAKQIAEALEAAHEKGVTHRDLKPGNVMITPNGLVKVLDFGLAAMASPAAHTGDPENSPTLTMGMTAAGTIMGTAAYMSPEQASGLQVDKRSDIWSYGAVLWEMLTGKRLFVGGESLSHTLADVLRAPIDFEKIPAGKLRRLLRRCLDRNLKTRLQSIAEARIAIDEKAEPEESGTGSSARASRLPYIVATAAALIVAGVLGWKLWSTPATLDRPLTRLSVDLGPEAQRHARVSVIISPDGTRIVYAAKAAGGLSQLMTRRLDQPNATVLVATPALNFEPFFSPDSQWVGFLGIGQIMKVPAQGGAAVPLGAPAGPMAGASWGDDNNILIGSSAGLWRLPASGGTPQPLPNMTGGHPFPQVLPGSKAVLVNSRTAVISDYDAFDIDALQFDTGKRKTLIHGGYSPRYLPTSGTTGHLLYIHAGALYGVGFDPGSLELVGTPTVLLDDVAADPAFAGGGGQFDVSKTGTFVYLSGKTQGTSFPISWLDASGKTAPLVSTSGNYGVPRLSPDGKQVAYLAAGGKGSDLWVYDIDRGTPTQLTFAGGLNSELAWARDSKHLVYGDGTALWWIRADGAGQRQPLLEKADTPRPFSFAPDGRLVFSPAVGGGTPYVSTLPLDLTDPEHPKPGKPEPFLAIAPFAQVDPVFSPDGKFIAYASGESGNEEVFVRPFPGPGGKWKVSSRGGKFPVFSAATHELLFLGGDDRIMAASYTTQGDAFSAGVPRVWSPTQVRRDGVRQNFDISPDGKRVVMFPRPVAEESSGNLHATFLLNFFDEVRRRVPVK